MSVTDDILTIATIDALAEEAFAQYIERIGVLEQLVDVLREEVATLKERVENLEDVTDAVTDEDDA